MLKRIVSAGIITAAFIGLLGIMHSDAVFANGRGGNGGGNGGGNTVGNNGTVKVDSQDFDSHPNNQPKVTCTFQVDFYNFDQLTEAEGTANVSFTYQGGSMNGDSVSTLSGDLTPFVGEDDATGANEEGLDASETYTLDLVGNPGDQVSVKLAVDMPGYRGNAAKQKVFKVTVCGSTNEEEEAGDLSVISNCEEVTLSISNVTPADADITIKIDGIEVTEGTQAELSVGTHEAELFVNGVSVDSQSFEVLNPEECGEGGSGGNGETPTTPTTPVTVVVNGGAGEVVSLPVTSGSSDKIAAIVTMIGAVLATIGGYVVRMRYAAQL